MEQQEDGVRESQMTFEMEWSVGFNDIDMADMDWKLHRFHVSKNMGSDHYLPGPKQSPKQEKILVEGQTLLNLDISAGECLRGGGGC